MGVGQNHPAGKLKQIRRSSLHPFGFGTTSKNIFLSHTQEMADASQGFSFLAAAMEAVEAVGHKIVEMKDFGSRAAPPAQVCKDEVSKSDIYVGLIGFRFGSSVRENPSISYVQLEYYAARDLGKPRLIFLKEENSEDTDSTHRDVVDERQRHFRQEVKNDNIVVSSFSTPAELAVKLTQALYQVGALTVLFIAANPFVNLNISTDEEFKAVDEALRNQGFPPQFDAIFRPAVRADELPELLQRYDPHIVHFGVPALTDIGFYMEDCKQLGQPLKVEDAEQILPSITAETLRQYLELSPRIKCCVFTTPLSYQDMRIVSDDGRLIVGTDDLVSNERAVAFSSGFYSALFSGVGLSESIEQGRDSMERVRAYINYPGKIICSNELGAIDMNKVR